jgi:hypothetical protein
MYVSLYRGSLCGGWRDRFNAAGDPSLVHDHVAELLSPTAASRAADEKPRGRRYASAASHGEEAKEAHHKTTRIMPAEPRPQGTKHLGDTYWSSQRQEREEFGRKHLTGPPDGRFCVDDLRETLGMKRVSKLEDGTCRRFRASGEQSIEGIVGRRRRIDPTDYATTRNGIGRTKPGDKNIARADYEAGYFKSGGVVTGSTSGCVSRG